MVDRLFNRLEGLHYDPAGQVFVFGLFVLKLATVLVVNDVELFLA